MGSEAAPTPTSPLRGTLLADTDSESGEAAELRQCDPVCPLIYDNIPPRGFSVLQQLCMKLLAWDTLQPPDSSLQCCCPAHKQLVIES